MISVFTFCYIVDRIDELTDPTSSMINPITTSHRKPDPMLLSINFHNDVRATAVADLPRLT